MKRRDFIKNSTILGLGCFLLHPQRAFASPTVISSLPVTITTPGDYVINQNLSVSLANGAAIEVKSDFVNVNLQGNTISNTFGVNTSAVGFVTGYRQGVTLRNGNLNGFHTAAMCLGAPTITTGYTINSVQTAVYACGFYVTGTGNNILNSTLNFTTRSTSAVIGMCSTAMGIVVDDSMGCLVRNNSIDLNDSGGTDGSLGIYFGPNGEDGIALDNSIANADGGIVSRIAADCRDNATTNVLFPYLGTYDLGNNT